ncbi:MAG TPA: hypothetical protein VF755_01035 [Catenuloplanes sp.]|jgi:hypothetical protein
MLWVNPAVEVAILSAERHASVWLWVDWDGDERGQWGSIEDMSALVTSYRLERSLDGELPEQVRIVAGAGAALARVTLTGTGGLSGAAYFSPLNPASPLGRTRVGRSAYLAMLWDSSDGPRLVPRLVGSTRAVSVNAASRQATLTMLDNRERLRGLVALPPIEGARYGANATWIISWALAVCGWTAAPRPRNMRRLGPVANARWISDAAVCLPLHGSLWPWFRGLSHGGGLPPDLQTVSANGGAPVPTRPRFVPGPFLLGAYAGATAANRYTAIRATLPASDGAKPVFETPARTGRLEMWVRGDAYPFTGNPSERAVAFSAHGFNGQPVFTVGVWRDRRVFAELLDGATVRFRVSNLELPEDGKWHFVGIAFRLSGSQPQVVLCVDDESETMPVTLSGSPAVTDLYTLTAYLPLADLQLTATPLDTAWLNDGITERTECDIDPSGLELDAVIERDQREAWGLLREIAAAEQAVTLCDEFGNFAYRTRARLAASTTPVLTLTAANAITDITVTESLDTVRTVVEVPYTAPTVGAGYAWSLDQPVHVPPNGRVTIPVVLDAPAVQLKLNPLLISGGAPSIPDSYFRAYSNPDGTGAAITSGFSASGGSFTTTGQGTVQFSNSTGQGVYVTEARLAGRVIRTRPTGAAVAEHPRLATSGEQPQPLRLPDSQWVQRHDVAAALAAAILPDVADPRPVVTDLAIRGDPRIQLGDRVRLVDRDGIGVDGDWWITGITETHEPTSGYAMRITARQAG